MADIANQRRTEVKSNNGWIEIKFKDLKKGDVFRLIEPTGEVVSDGQNTEFTAYSDAYQQDSFDGTCTWMINTSE